jgi:hypothetical protein
MRLATAAERAVWILAKPIEVPGKFLLQDKFPLCHWGLLLSGLEASELMTQWYQWRKLGQLPAESWGTLIELCRMPGNLNKYRVVNAFGNTEISGKWKRCAIAYCGESHLSDAELSTHGSPL